MKDSTLDKLEGKKDKAVGNVKEGVGRMTDNERLEAEGEGQQVGGKVKDKVGDVKKVFNK